MYRYAYSKQYSMYMFVHTPTAVFESVRERTVGLLGLIPYRVQTASTTAVYIIIFSQANSYIMLCV